MSSAGIFRIPIIRARPAVTPGTSGRRAPAEFGAAPVGGAPRGLASQFAELRKHLYTEDGRLRAFVNVYLNDEDIRYLAKENTPTKDGDTISIIPSIAGGSFGMPIDFSLTGSFCT